MSFSKNNHYRFDTFSEEIYFSKDVLKCKLCMQNSLLKLLLPGTYYNKGQLVFNQNSEIHVQYNLKLSMYQEYANLQQGVAIRQNNVRDFKNFR